MNYQEYSIKVASIDQEMALAVLYDFPIEGIEIVDPYITKEEADAMFVADFAIPNEKQEEIELKFYIPYTENYQEIYRNVKKEFQRMNIDAKFNENQTDDSTWDSWKEFYKPFMVTKDIAIKPVWEELEKNTEFANAKIVIDIDPGMAFGSGTHETTSMCIKAIEKYMKKNDCIIDLGCGSGILGIAAEKLGSGKGYLIDLDESAIKIAKENIKNNKVKKLEVIHGDLLENIDVKVDIVVANIFANIIMAVTPDVKKTLKNNGIFISSGIIKERKDEVIEKLKEYNFFIEEVVNDGEWVTIISKSKNEE